MLNHGAWVRLDRATLAALDADPSGLLATALPRSMELALRAVPGGRDAVEARSDELNGNGDEELAALKRRKS